MYSWISGKLFRGVIDFTALHSPNAHWSPPICLLFILFLPIFCDIDGDDGGGTEGDLQKGEEEEEEEEDSDEDDIKITIDHEKIDEAKTSYQVKN